MRIKLDKGAIMPTRAHELDAGLDLYSRDDGWIAAHTTVMVDTGVHIELPDCAVGEVLGRSGMSRRGIWVAHGTIDAGYRGSICVIIANLTDEDYHIRVGDRIAQLVIVQCMRPPLEVVGSLNDSDRADGGFGSTGR